MKMLLKKMKNIGYRLIQIAGSLILLGGLFDVLMTFILHNVPKSHVDYLKLKDGSITTELQKLDQALLRAIGGCLIGLGIATLTIFSGRPKNMQRSSIFSTLSLITIAEGINGTQMILIHSSYFFYPLLCVLITWFGTLFLIVKPPHP